MSIDQRRRLGTALLFGVSLPLTLAVLVLAGVVVATGGHQGQLFAYAIVLLVVVSTAFARLGRLLRKPSLK